MRNDPQFEAAALPYQVKMLTAFRRTAILVKTPAGKFKGCAKFEDTNPLDSPPTSEFKWFCPGVGLVRDVDAEGFIELVSYTNTSADARATSERTSDVNVSQSDDGSGDADE